MEQSRRYMLFRNILFFNNLKADAVNSKTSNRLVQLFWTRFCCTGKKVNDERILIIDDDDILEIFNLIFQDAGYNVVISNNGETADHIHEIGPDLVILDIRIKGSAKNGGEICAEIKEKFKNARVSVILISGETDISSIAENCGADGFISKPFDIPHVLAQIKQLLH
jgi:DNA-binding response OmpR family regulator